MHSLYTPVVNVHNRQSIQKYLYATTPCPYGREKHLGFDAKPSPLLKLCEHHRRGELITRRLRPQMSAISCHRSGLENQGEIVPAIFCPFHRLSSPHFHAQHRWTATFRTYTTQRSTQAPSARRRGELRNRYEYLELCHGRS